MYLRSPRYICTACVIFYFLVTVFIFFTLFIQSFSLSRFYSVRAMFCSFGVARRRCRFARAFLSIPFLTLLVLEFASEFAYVKESRISENVGKHKTGHFKRYMKSVHKGKIYLIYLAWVSVWMWKWWKFSFARFVIFEALCLKHHRVCMVSGRARHVSIFSYAKASSKNETKHYIATDSGALSICNLMKLCINS